MNLIEVGSRIRNCRKTMKLTQEELSEKVDVSAHYIYEIEKGLKTMSLYTLADIAKALNVSTDYLLFGDSGYCNTNSIQELSDRLFLITKNIPLSKRESVADILEVMIQYIEPK